MEIKICKELEKIDDWKYDVIKCFDCDLYQLVRNGESKCLSCGKENTVWIDGDEPEMEKERFLEVCEDIKEIIEKLKGRAIKE